MKNLEFVEDVFPDGNVIHTNEKIITRKKKDRERRKLLLTLPCCLKLD